MKRLVWRILAFLHLDSLAVAIQRKYLRTIWYSLAQLLWYMRPETRVAPDGLPLPPPRLTFLVTGKYDVGYFYQNGILGAESIQSVLAKNGLNMCSFKSVLDFGCGCGRIMRHWNTITGAKFYGTDYNPHLVEWCRKALPFAEFGTNELSPGLRYRDNQFDFIYAISVFTHLNENLSRLWMDELTRVLNPGGFLLITVHGKSRFFQLTPKEIQQFESGQLVLRKENRAGTNDCSVYHPEQYVRQNLARKLALVDFVPAGARDGSQDVYLLQKPVAGLKE